MSVRDKSDLHWRSVGRDSVVRLVQVMCQEERDAQVSYRKY